MSKIYNKNAREKALLEEAYTGVYTESAVDVELESWWEYDPHDVVVKVYHGALHAMPPGEGTPEYEANSEKIFTWLKGKYPKPDYNIDDVKFRERTSADATEWALRQDEDAEGAWPPKVHKEGAVDVELESWWEYDPHDVVVKVYHGALHALPPAQGTPEYEANFEKIFTWLEGKYPQHTEDAEGALGNLAAGVGRGIGDVASGVGRVGLAAGGAGVAAAGGALGAVLKIAKTLTADQLKALGEYALEKAAEDEEEPVNEWVAHAAKGLAAAGKAIGKGAATGAAAGAASGAQERVHKAVAGAEDESREERADVDKYEYEQGKEAGEREDHDKGVKMAHEALEMFKDELHVGGHGEDINVNELADAHDQLSRALHWLLDETDVEYITGGRATQKAEAEVDFKPAYGEY